MGWRNNAKNICWRLGLESRVHKLRKWVQVSRIGFRTRDLEHVILLAIQKHRGPAKDAEECFLRHPSYVLGVQLVYLFWACYNIALTRIAYLFRP